MVTSNLFKKNRSRRNYEKEHTECSESVDDQNVNREHHANVKPKKGTSGKFDSQLIATGVERNERTPTYTGVDYSELEEDSSIREAESCPKISGGFNASHDAQNTLIDSSERVQEDAYSEGRIMESQDPRFERMGVQEFTSSEDRLAKIQEAKGCEYRGTLLGTLTKRSQRTA